MTLKTIIDRIILATLLASILICLVCFYFLGRFNHQQALDLKRAELSMLLAKELPFLKDELVNRRFYAVKIRSAELLERSSTHLVFLGLYEPNGQAIFESGSPQPSTDRVEIHEDIPFAGETLGHVVLADRLSSGAETLLGKAMLTTLGVLILSFCMLFLAARRFIDQFVLSPLATLTGSIPGIRSYLHRESSELPVSIPLRSSDLEKVSKELMDMSRELRVGLEKSHKIRLEAERQNVRANLARQVAHDIRSPVAALDMAIPELNHLSEEKRVLLRAAVGRIRDIANQLIQTTRSDSGARHLSPQAISPKEPATVEHLFGLVDMLVTEKRLQFREQIGVDLDFKVDSSGYGACARVQKTEFLRALSNIINNSFEALNGTGRIAVELRREQSNVVLTVRDSGPGIPENLLLRLGKEEITQNKPNGSGMGIYHASLMLQSWGGELRIKSGRGSGTEVALCLPQSEMPEWFLPELALSPGEVVVVLDDDTSVHQIWKERFLRAKANDFGISLIHCASVSDFENWFWRPRTPSRITYLFDFELIGVEQSGLDLIEKFGLASQSILVTSHFEEQEVRGRAEMLGIKMIPKSLAAFIPVNIRRLDHSNPQLPGADAPQSC